MGPKFLEGCAPKTRTREGVHGASVGKPRGGCTHSFACWRQLRGLEKDGICIIINIDFILSLQEEKLPSSHRILNRADHQQRPSPQAQELGDADRKRKA